MRLFGLIGYPLGHSFSMRYFTDKFAAEGISDCAYRNFPIEQIQALEPLLHDHPALQGFNVTIPYKQQILPHLAHLSDEARAIGAVNCVRITPQGLVGHNTDAYGFRRSLLELLDDQRPERALLLGSGGASKAVAYVLHALGIACDNVSRHTDRGQYTYATLTAADVARHQLIVNATPLGTFPAIEGYPAIPYEAIGPSHFLFDLVYNPPLTQFLKRGKAQGAKISNGYPMLVGQAEKAWEIWNAPLEAICHEK